jgi:hypothetical protein
LLASMSGATLAQSAAAPTGAARPMQQRFADLVQRRLDHLAQRLQIRTDQQDAWTAYERAVRGSFALSARRPDVGADAATWARYRADRAAERARQLAQQADAIAALQKSLSPAQVQTLGQALRGASENARGREHGGRH